MEKYVIIVFCGLLGGSVSQIPSVSKYYRTDYEYNRKTDAFYKLHIEGIQNYHAQKICQSEGAELMIPTTDVDIKQLHAMFKKFPDLGNYVFVGNDGQNHESAEEHPIIDLTQESEEACTLCNCDVVTRTGEVETMYCFRRLPFICKVDAKKAPYSKQCKVYAKDYKYFPSVGSCYKIPRIALTWNQAFAECQAHGAHLVVLNSQAEHDAVHNLTRTEPKVPGSWAFYYFLAGFRAEKDVTPVVFKTIFNQTLEEAGYSQWAPNEPNNALSHEFCGSIFKNDGNLNDVDCNGQFGFICEKEIPTPAN